MFPGRCPELFSKAFPSKTYQLICYIKLLIPNKNIKLILNYFGGPLLFCTLFYSIYSQLHEQAGWQQSFRSIWSALWYRFIPVILVFCLMFINWAIEAFKWKIAMKQHAISFRKSLKAVFAGNALAFFTPNRTGEYFGRMLYVAKNDRISSVGLTMICSYAQVIVTLIAGACGVLFIRKDLALAMQNNTIFPLVADIGCCLALSAGVGLTIIYFQLNGVARTIFRISWFARWHRYAAVLEGVNATILWHILSLSLARYIVFIMQYFLLFSVFAVDITWWQAFWSISVVFLIIAVAPSLGFLTELGVRWQAGIQLVQVYSSNVAGIFAASLAVWMINLAIPALIGGALITGLKIFDNKKHRDQAGFT